MRVGFVSTMNVAPWGGSEALWAAAAGEAITAGHDVLASVVDWPQMPPPLAELERRGATMRRRITLERLRRSLLKRALYRFYRPLVFRPQAHWRDLISFRPDVVCVSQGSVYDAVRHREGLAEVLLTLGKPYVVVSHTTAEGDVLKDFEREAARSFFRHASRLAFVAARTAATVQRQLASRPLEAAVLRNPVNLADTSPVPWPTGDTVNLAAVGRVEVAKGIDVLFETLGQGAWPTRDWRLRLYGDSPNQAYFDELAARYGIADRVDFCGHVADVRGIWADNHLLVMPSRQESAPLAVVEAMLCGRPVVATDVGGMREWVDEGQHGFLAEAPLPRYLDAALERAWQARDRWPDLGRQAHAQAAGQIDPNPGKSLLDLLVRASGGVSA